MDEKQVARFIVTPLAITISLVTILYIYAPHLINKEITEALDKFRDNADLMFTSVKLRILARNKIIDELDAERKEAMNAQDFANEVCQAEDDIDACIESITEAMKAAALANEQGNAYMGNALDNAVIINNAHERLDIMGIVTQINEYIDEVYKAESPSSPAPCKTLGEFCGPVTYSDNGKRDFIAGVRVYLNTKVSPYETSLFSNWRKKEKEQVNQLTSWVNTAQCELDGCA